MTIHYPKALNPLFKHIHNIGGRPIIVGGYVRDSLLVKPTKDIDLEVFNMDSLTKLTLALSALGKVLEVGKQFQVIKLKLNDAPELDIDIALPRSETKTSAGHRGFHTEPNPSASFKEAASRRDFTINAIGYDPITEELLDPFNGQQDLANKVLRHVGPAFAEDPLRVLRAMQFTGRFQLNIAPETLNLCQKMDLSELPTERLYMEFEKLLLKALRPSQGLKWLPQLGAIDLFPELKALIGTPQNPKWHPEGDVWTHTLMVVDEMAKRKTGNTQTDLALLFAALCHDMGKPSCTKQENGVWRSLGHEQKGVPIAKQFMQRLTEEKELWKHIEPLVREHGNPLNLYLSNQHTSVSNAAIRRLSLRAPLKELCLLATADSCGRTTEDALRGDVPHIDWLITKAKQLSIYDAPPTPLLTGQDLIVLGIKEGPKIGELLSKVFEAQLDDRVTTKAEALDWIKSHVQ